MNNQESKKDTVNTEEEFFDQFEGGEKEQMREIWQISSQAPPPAVEVSDGEIDRALAEMQGQIAGGTHNYGRWRWFAAAAVLLLVLGAGMLFIPQTVEAPRGEIVEATLPDGSTVTLNSGSTIQYNRLFSFTDRTLSLEGEAFFDVQEGDHPFIVEANGTAVKVTGTQFNVRSWADELGKETEVAVAEGKVTFYSVRMPEQFVTIQEGEYSRWTPSLSTPAIPEMVSIEKRIGWQQNKLLFNAKPLLVIFNELERRFDLSIEFEAKQMADETLTAFYNNPKDAQSVLEDICRVKGLRFARTVDGYRVYR